MPSLYGRQWGVLHLRAHLLSFFGRISMITEHWSISSSGLLLHKLEDARVASGAQWLPLAVLGCKYNYNPFSTPGNESAICFLCSEICSNIREMRGKCETTITLWYPLLQHIPTNRYSQMLSTSTGNWPKVLRGAPLQDYTLRTHLPSGCEVRLHYTNSKPLSPSSLMSLFCSTFNSNLVAPT